MSCRFLLGVIVRNAKRLQRLADDILDVTRIESKSFTLNKQKLNINEVIVDVIEDYRDQIEKSDNQKELAYERIVYENNNNEDIISRQIEKDSPKLFLTC
jgi:signal transduction histidine kinase